MVVVLSIWVGIIFHVFGFGGLDMGTRLLNLRHYLLEVYLKVYFTDLIVESQNLDDSKYESASEIQGFNGDDSSSATFDLVPLMFAFGYVEPGGA